MLSLRDLGPRLILPAILAALTTTTVAPRLGAPTSPPSKAVVDHWPPYDDDLYGPHFIAANPSAETWYEDVFSTKLMPGAKYYLKVNNPAPGASGAVGNFSVKLNGVYVADPGMMGGQSELVKEVPLQAFNRIEVWTAPGSGQLRVIIRMEPMTHIAPAYAERVQPAAGQADVTKSWQVTVPSDAGGNRILVIDNGDYDRSGRIGQQEWGEIKINGVHAATFDTLHSEQSKLVVPVNLPNGTSTIQATLNQVVPGAHVHVRVMYADTAKPKLTVTAPANGAVVSSPSVTVSGTYNDPMWGSVNVGNSQSFQTVSMAHLAGVQSWSVSHPLNVGPNTIKIWARDGAGNTSDTVTRVVTRQSGGGSGMTVAAQGRNPGVTVERDECLTIAAGDNAAYECGDLRLVHELPVTRTMNREHAPALIYNSSHAAGRAIIAADVSVPSGINSSSLEATVSIPGKPNTVRTFTWNAAWSGGPARRIVVPIHGPTVGLPTGMYAYTLQVRAMSGTSALASGSDTGTVVVVDRSTSPYGAGWWIAGLEQLLTVSATEKLWIGGDGSTRRYVRQDASTWLAEPMVDRPDTLLSVGASGWQRRLRNGVYVEFDGAQRHVATVNRQGHRTAFTHDSVGVVTIALPVPAGTSRVYTFTYAPSAPRVLTQVAAPAAGAQARLTRLGYRAGTRLVDSIAGPDNLWIDLRYDASNRIDGRRNRRGDWTSYAYNEAELLRQVSIDMSRTGEPAIVTSFCPAESRSVASCASGPQLLPSVYTWLDGPRVDVVDTTTFAINRFGAPTAIVDAIGQATTIERTDSRFPVLVTAVVNPSGFRNEAFYNARGLLDSTRAVNPLGDGRNAVARYQWDPKWSFVTSAAPPEGPATTHGYAVQTGHRLWSQLGGDTTHFAYDADGLLDSVRASNGAVDKYTYDARKNLQTHRRPNGSTTSIVADDIGRIVSTSTPTGTASIVTRTDYDVRDRDSVSVKYGEGSPDTLRVLTLYDAEDNVLTVEQRALPPRAEVPGGLLVDVVSRQFTYDAAGRKIGETGAGDVRSWSYDAAGNLKSSSEDIGATLVYDPINRLGQRAGTLDSARYTYDVTGGTRTANNLYAQISRSYYPNGALKGDTTRIANAALNGFSAPYGLTHTYDLSGRRTGLQLPATVGGSIAYGYDARTGQLATITDRAGVQYRYTYDLQARVDSVIRRAGLADQISEKRSYDIESNVQQRSVVSGATTYFNETYAYDALNRIRHVGLDSTRYDGLGHVIFSRHGGARETLAFDALGNRLRLDAQYLGRVRPFKYQYYQGTNRIAGEFRLNVWRAQNDTAEFDYTGSGVGALTDRSSRQWFDFAQDTGYVQTQRRNEFRGPRMVSSRFFYDTTWVVTMGTPRDSAYESLETYRYDALGRRVWQRMIFPDSRCDQVENDTGCSSSVTSSVWDGSAILLEERAPSDTGWIDNLATGDQYGLVTYVHGLEIDRPLGVLKKNAHDLIPLSRWDGAFTTGACPSSPCAQTDVYFPMVDQGMYGARYDAVQSANWYGSLIVGMRDGSGYVYQRNRYLDPSTGLFTQTDPLGLAGGLNLYGFADGDPVNYSDPFGLDCRVIATGAKCPGPAPWTTLRQIGRIFASAAADLLVKEFKALRGDYACGDPSLACGVIPFSGAFGPAGRGGRAASAVRTEARNLTEQLTMQEARAGAGREIMQGKINDPRYPQDTWAKMSHTHKHPGGEQTEVHYWKHRETGATEGYKFTKP